MKIWQNKWLILFILMLTWGSSFILIKHSVKAFSPMQVGALRLTIAGLVLVAFGIPNLKLIPKNRMIWVLASGCLGNFIPMFLFPIAQQKVSSAAAGILDSLVPIFVLILGFLCFKIRSSWTQVLGATIGFFGAIILIGYNGEGQSNDIFHSMLIILATLMYGMSALIISRYLADIPSFRLSSAVFTIWFGPALLILGFSGFFKDFTGSPEQMKGLGYIAILGLFGTAVAMILFYNLIRLTSAVFASSVTYLMPLVAVIWGLLDGEKLTWEHAIGGLLILLGVYLIQGRTRKKEAKINPNQSGLAL